MIGLRVTGAELALWLERSASLYHQIAPGAQDVDLINLDFPSFNFDVIFGLSYRIDLAQPARFDPTGRVANPSACRITDLRHQGVPVAADQVFALATNSYRNGRGRGFAATTPAQVICASPQANRDIVEAFIRAGGQAVVPAEPVWGFEPMPGTRVSFDSNPRAVGCLPEVPHLNLTPLMQMPNGFQRFRLQL